MSSLTIQKTARSKAGKKRYRIGSLVIPTDPYWVQAFESITATISELGDELVMLQPASSLQELYAVPKDELVDHILAHSLDVLICTAPPLSVLNSLLYECLPVVCLAEITIDHPLFTSMISLYQGGYLAGKYIGNRLGAKGHAICIWAGLEEIITKGELRLNGFLDGLQDRPEITTGNIPAFWSYQRSFPVIQNALQSYPEKIDAIFGVSDSLLMAARDAGQKLGVIHDETILVGLNGDPDALAAVALGDIDATIDTASEQLGAEAVRAAHRIAQGKPQPRQLPQKFELITRDNAASIATHKLATIASITNRMVGHNRLREQERLSQLEISMEITRQIGSIMDRKRLFAVIRDLVQQYYGYEWMYILRWSEKDGKLSFYEGSPSNASQRVSPENDELVQQVFKTSEPVLIPDASSSLRWQARREWQDVRGRAVLPIQLGTQVIGVLDLRSKKPILERSLETIGLELLANQLGIAIQNADLYQEALQASVNAQQANELKTRLVANVGHEMRTPLNAILGFSQTIQKKLENQEEIAKDQLLHDIQHIYDSGEHLMYVINDLLDLSRAEIGALNLYFEAVEPKTFLEEIFHNFTDSISTAPEVSWKLKIPNKLPMIRADAVRLRQILINLMANAAKFTRKGTITMGAQVELPYLHLWIEDTGPGVPVEIQEKIFEPFNFSNNKRRPEGIGLGLSITRHLVSLHEGVITLESNPGTGSVFHVYLPLPGSIPTGLTTGEIGKQAILLVITTNNLVPENVYEICKRQALKPYLVHNLYELNTALHKGTPAAIAWDLANASSAEWKIISIISTRPKCSTLPIILYDAQEIGMRADTGLTNILFKPTNGNTLKDWLSQNKLEKKETTKIIVVDDDCEARRYYQNLLKTVYPEGQIIFAEDGRQAIDQIQTETPDLILLDLIMPKVDGFTVLEFLRSREQTRHVPVIIISGKLLTYEDIERLNHLKTVHITKGILSDDETYQFLCQLEDDEALLPQPTSQLVKQGLAYLQQNFDQPITRKDMAEAVGVSENYLSQIFRTEIHISPWDYLNRYRILKAKSLLLESSDKVTMIATKVGFNDSAYFSRVFRKHTGKAPQEFRNNPQ